MYKVNIRGKEYTYEKYNDVVFCILNECSKSNLKVTELGIVAYKIENGEKKTIFQSYKLIIGQEVWAASPRHKAEMCEVCDGQGYSGPLNEKKCFACDGSGWTHIRTDFIKLSGPFIVKEIYEEKTILELKNSSNEQLYTIPNKQIFYDKEAGKKYVEEFNRAISEGSQNVY